MSAGTYNMVMEQGATFSQEMTWKIDKNPVNLTGYSARMQVRGSGSGNRISTRLALSLTSENGDIILGGSEGTITINISASSASNVIPAGKYFYDLELQSPNGEVTRLIKGTFTVVAEMTR
jgi:hypothetical protein